jgi:predicted anti-sigma-YlaC factor YlaD
VGLALLAALWLGGCSTASLAANAMADALAESGEGFASDDDPELVREALPFSLKLMESLLYETPRHRGLLVACAKGFTQYAYAFVQLDASERELEDFAEAQALRQRAKRLYLRARGYGLRALELDHVRWRQALDEHPRAAVRTLGRGDLEALYWTAAAWAGAIGLSKDDPARIGELPQVESMIDRALELDPAFDAGGLQGLALAFEPARAGAESSAHGATRERARGHFERALALSGGLSAGPLVSWAETYSVQDQDVEEFERLLQRALAIDPELAPKRRLANLILQRRARWLLDHVEDLFLIPGAAPTP